MRTRNVRGEMPWPFRNKWTRDRPAARREQPARPHATPLAGSAPRPQPSGERRHELRRYVQYQGVLRRSTRSRLVGQATSRPVGKSAALAAAVPRSGRCGAQGCAARRAWIERTEPGKRAPGCACLGRDSSRKSRRYARCALVEDPPDPAATRLSSSTTHRKSGARQRFARGLDPPLMAYSAAILARAVLAGARTS